MGRRGAILHCVAAVIGCGVPPEGESQSTVGQDGSSTTDLPTDATAGPSTAEPSEDSTDTAAIADVAGPCGNGVLEAGEVCDDGNAVDGDGCNDDCRPSGEVELDLVLDPMPLGNEAIFDIDHADDGTYVVGGSVAGAGQDAWVARLTADDAFMWDVVIVDGTYDDAIHGVAAAEGGRVFAAGVVDQLRSAGDAWITALSATGTIDAVNRIDSTFFGRWLEVADAGDGVVVVGQQDDALGSRGLVRRYGYGLALHEELEPVDVGPGVMIRDACPSAEALFVVGHRQDGAALAEGVAALIQGSTTQWLGTSTAQRGQHSYTVACAVAGAGDDRRLWSAGWDTAATPRWLATVRAHALDGTVAHEAATWVGDMDLGAFYNDVATDAEGNAIVVGGTVVGEGETDWGPVVRKFDPRGELLWSRAFSAPGHPLGALEGVDVAPDGRIRVVGWVAEPGGLRLRWLARLTP